MVFCKKKSVIN